MAIGLTALRGDNGTPSFLTVRVDTIPYSTSILAVVTASLYCIRTSEHNVKCKFVLYATFATLTPESMECPERAVRNLQLKAERKSSNGSKNTGPS